MSNNQLSYSKILSMVLDRKLTPMEAAYVMDGFPVPVGILKKNLARPPRMYYPFSFMKLTRFTDWPWTRRIFGGRYAFTSLHDDRRPL